MLYTDIEECTAIQIVFVIKIFAYAITHSVNYIYNGMLIFIILLVYSSLAIEPICFSVNKNKIRSKFLK